MGNGYLSDWYISSVSNESPVWTDEHIDELLNDFIVIPKDTPTTDVPPMIHSRWIPMDDGTYNAYCESCGQERGSKSWNKDDFKYCFGCGAKMDSDTEGDVAEQNTEVNKPDGNCLDCKFQYLEGSDYWCSICPGNPEDI